MVKYRYSKSTFIGSDDELLNVTELNCSKCEITSFEGLNAPNLTTLYCYSNQLTSFQHLTNVPLLTNLYCCYNQLTSFQHLDCVPLLTTLYCYRNQLTSFQHLTNVPLLTTLNCSRNQLTSFQHLTNVPLLTFIECSRNQLTSFQYLNHVPLLTFIDCSNNQLTSFHNLDHVPLLTALHCSINQLTSFQHLNNVPLLSILECSRNQLTSFQYLNHVPNLTSLCCSNHRLTSFQHLDNVPLLTHLYCNDNQLTSFQHLNNMPLLTLLYCQNNQLTSFQGLNAPLLTTLACHGNEWEFIPPHINRLLNTTRNNQNIYTDGQNVHNHHIQESIRNSIQAVLLQKPNITEEDLYETILSDTTLTAKTKEILVEYCKDPHVHSTLNITFEELLLHVFSRIQQNENKDEIKSVLNAEMSDSVCKCFTGCMSRLINCLNGFDDLVSIRISDTEQIGQVIGMIKEQLETNNEYTVEKHKQLVTEELKARNYLGETIAEWIAFIE